MNLISGKKVLLLFIIVFPPAGLYSQQDTTDSKGKLNAAADIVSGYIWRGVVSDLSPNIQPSLFYTKGNFEAGFWGSSNFSATYKETDFYLQYSLKNFTVGVYDYFWCNKKYFVFDKNKTGHVVETYIIYEGSDKFPLKLTAASWVYGDDKMMHINSMSNDTSYTNLYSSYMEAAYTFSFKNNNLEVAIGGTPKKGYYGGEAGIVNITVTGSREVKITDKYSLPVKVSVIANPQKSQIFTMFGITI